MAGSTSTGKAKELQNKKKQEDHGNKREDRSITMHAQMESDWIKAWRNQRIWLGQEEQKYNWRWWRSNSSIPTTSTLTATVEEMEETVLMRNYDFDYVLKNHLLDDDEQIVWTHDVWGLQNFHQIPISHDKHASINDNSSDR